MEGGLRLGDRPDSIAEQSPPPAGKGIGPKTGAGPDGNTAPGRQPDQAVVVLGMHRSGTSALTGVLSLLGGRLPASLMPATEDNAKGYFESFDFADLHDELLTEAGTEWYSHEGVDPAWFATERGALFRDRLKAAILRNYPDRDVFLVKDPRASRLFPLWHDVLRELGCEPKIVISVRNPVDVGRSILKREATSLEHTYLVWLRHMLDAERDTRGLSRTIVHYDDLLADWRPSIDRLCAQLQIRFPRGRDEAEPEIDAFLTAELRHSRTTASDFPAGVERWIRDASGAFRALEADPEDPVAIATLDGVAAEFDRMAAIFAPVLATARTRIAEASALAAGAGHDADGDGSPTQIARLEVDLALALQHAAAVEAHSAGIAVDRDAAWLDVAAAERALAATRWELKVEREFGQIRTGEVEQARAELAATRGELEQALLREQQSEVDRQQDDRRIAGLRDRVREMVTRRTEQRRRARSGLLARWRAVEPHDLPVSEHDADLVRISGLLDPDWYYASYPDVEIAGLDALEHFMRYGDKEGRSPGPHFDSPAYLASHPEAAEIGVLLHHLRSRLGRTEPAADRD